ncbi:MAG: hypothetical protein VYA34_04075 [Myxococcota bacterium]|nr:hypothetical protein [Myxococcota bacterium]
MASQSFAKESQDFFSNRQGHMNATQQLYDKTMTTVLDGTAATSVRNIQWGQIPHARPYFKNLSTRKPISLHPHSYHLFRDPHIQDMMSANPNHVLLAVAQLSSEDHWFVEPDDEKTDLRRHDKKRTPHK